MNTVNILLNTVGALDIGTLSKADAAALIAPQILKIITKYKTVHNDLSIEVLLSDDSGDCATCSLKV